MIESAFTAVPGLMRIRSTRPSVVAGIQRISSGTSVPRPRTCRSIGPRFTVSTHTVARDTEGAAGFRCDRPTVMAARAVTPPMPYRVRVTVRLRLLI